MMLEIGRAVSMNLGGGIAFAERVIPKHDGFVARRW